jgi:hypothetical protein
LYIPNKTFTALTEKVGSSGDACGLYLGRARFECRQRHANVTSGSRGFNQYIQVRLQITLELFLAVFPIHYSWLKQALGAV